MAENHRSEAADFNMSLAQVEGYVRSSMRAGPNGSMSSRGCCSSCQEKEFHVEEVDASVASESRSFTCVMFSERGWTRRETEVVAHAFEQASMRGAEEEEELCVVEMEQTWSGAGEEQEDCKAKTEEVCAEKKEELEREKSSCGMREAEVASFITGEAGEGDVSDSPISTFTKDTCG